MRFFFKGLIVLCVFFSCSDKNINTINVSDINVDFSIKRFDLEFYNATENSLPKVKEEYPYLFPVEFTDSLSLSKINSKEEQGLFKEVENEFKSFSFENAKLKNLFKHIKYYNREFESPDVITVLTNIDYENRVIYADSLLFISLDSYLGKSHKFYSDFPSYIKENNTKEHLIVDVASSIIETQFPSSTNRRFIDKIIYEGKKIYFLDSYLPLVLDSEKMGYSKEKYNWAVANEEQIWMYFIDKNLLFSTDTKLNSRFIENAPFSKFYMEQDNLSPGRIGVWIGWQIVKSFMKNNDVSLQELVKFDEDILFKKSKYKPRK